jgi:hypothetical protein
MIVISRRIHRVRRRAIPLAACALLAGLAGCSNLPDSMSGAFVDPSKFELYSCLQLRDVRKANAARITELRRLMAKAETGTAGPVMAEVAYGNDYVSARAQSNLADEVWQRHKCDQEVLPPEKPAAPAVAPKEISPGHKHNRPVAQ